MLKFLLGVVLGMAVAVAYVHWGFDLPDKLQIATKLRGNLVSTAVEGDLYDLDLDSSRRQRALEVLFANRPQFAAAVDDEMGHPFLEALMRNRAAKDARRLVSSWPAFDRVLAQTELRAALEEKHATRDVGELKRRMLAEAFSRETFLAAWIRRRGPAAAEGDLLAALREVAGRSADEQPGTPN